MAEAAKFDKSLFTAKFKRDYVAYSAVVIFVVIVLSEVFLAVSIPTYFVSSDLWDLQIARQDLLRDFDYLRGNCLSFSGKNPETTEENNILLWNLNLMSNYLRVNEDCLRWEDIRALKDDLMQIRQLHNQLRYGKPFNRPLSLKTGAALEALRTELTGGEKK